MPLTVIFPAGDPLHPIVIRDLYAKSELLRKLDEAVEIANRCGIVNGEARVLVALQQARAKRTAH